MNLHSRYAIAAHGFNKQCRLFKRICSNLFTDLGIRDIIKTRNEERNNLIKRSKIMGKMFEKRWDHHHGYATAYWVDIEKPIIVFDSGFNEVVKYDELPEEYKNVVDRAIDEFEEGYNNVIRLGCKLYECFNYARFSFMREIENFDETIYSNNDFKEV